MNILLTLPYCRKDSGLLAKCLAWMRELRPQGYRPHSCLLVADETVPYDDRLALKNSALEMFAAVDAINVKIPPESQRWPTAPNIMFASAARQIMECYRLPWLWFEPDAVPLVGDWLHTLADAYEACPKRFMGSLVPSDSQPDMPPVHLAGCAIYDPGAYVGLQPYTGTQRAWDIAAAGYTVPRAMNSPLMQHFWGKLDLAPTFALTPTTISPPNTFSLDSLIPQAVTFHRCKDGSLIDLLRQKAQSQPVKPVSGKVKQVRPRTHHENAVSP